jgi:hypothetical protein
MFRGYSVRIADGAIAFMGEGMGREGKGREEKRREEKRREEKRREECKFFWLIRMNICGTNLFYDLQNKL